jgi:hypothetical protein
MAGDEKTVWRVYLTCYVKSGLEMKMKISTIDSHLFMSIFQNPEKESTKGGLQEMLGDERLG